jgi:hypothetical protein
MNNFAELSDRDSAKFLVRWRGRQEGPYLASVIESKLAANEIGLLHEVFYEGKWVTIRDYITEKEAILRAERLAREEQERRAREETERQAREREEKRQPELLAEDHSNPIPDSPSRMAVKSEPKSGETDKRILPTMILCCLLGIFGIHAFYAGRLVQGFFYVIAFIIAIVLVNIIVPFSAIEPLEDFVFIHSFFFAILMLPTSIFLLGDFIRIVTGVYMDGENRKITKWT